MITYPRMNGRVLHHDHDRCWPETLNELPPAAWSRLARALERANDPWRTPVVSTPAVGNTPNARTVVLRDVDPARATLAFHTHRMAPKMNEWRDGTALTWVFHNPDAGVQLRATGSTVALIRGPRWLSAWERLPPRQKLLYQQDTAPGKMLPAGRSRARSVLNAQQARERFVVFETRVDNLHLLFLEAPINRAAQFTRAGSDWKGYWVAA